MSFSTGIDSLLSLSAIPASTAGCVLEQDVVEKPSRSLPQSSPEKKEYGFAHGEIRVVIFTQDEHCDLRDLLECESGMRVVATSKSNDALAMIEKHHPELAVFDIGTEGNSAMSPLNSYRLSKKNSSIDTPMTLLVAPDMTYLYQAFESRPVYFFL